MTIEAAKLVRSGSLNSVINGAPLSSSSTTALAKKGRVYYDEHPQFGARGFQYVRFDVATTAGDVSSYRANVNVDNITSGTTTTITTSGLTADILVDGIIYCVDDNGGAGAAPEGEKALVVANTTTVITIDSKDAFSAAPAANDDFDVILPWAVNDSSNGDAAGIVAGVAMADQAQYDYGWVQFYGIHPTVATVAAGTAIVIYESVVADAGTVNDGAADAADLRIGRALHQLTTDTVRRVTMIDLFCGKAYGMGLSA